jgi:hypothetical protein
MRKKLLQHTLPAAIAAWALSMVQGPVTADHTAASLTGAAQVWAIR